MSPGAKTIAVGTAVAASLDLLCAFVLGAIDGRGPLPILAGIAAGPFGNALSGGAAVPAGAAVHFGIMAAMVAAFVLAAERWPWLRSRPLASGFGYGILLYLLMYWIVLPLRWPSIHPSLDPRTIGGALFAHIVCVGLPIAFITAAMLPGRGEAR